MILRRVCLSTGSTTPFVMRVQFGPGNREENPEDNLGMCIRYEQQQCSTWVRSRLGDRPTRCDTVVSSLVLYIIPRSISFFFLLFFPLYFIVSIPARATVCLRAGGSRKRSGTRTTARVSNQLPKIVDWNVQVVYIFIYAKILDLLYARSR